MIKYYSNITQILLKYYSILNILVYLRGQIGPEDPRDSGEHVSPGGV